MRKLVYKRYRQQIKVGTLYLWVSKDAILKAQHTLISIMLIIMAAVFLIIIVGTTLMMRAFLNKPILQLIEGIRSIAAGNYNAPLPEVPQSNLNTIVQEVNLMAGEIGRRDQKQRQAEGALKKSESKYRGIFENAQEGIFQSTRDGRLITVNASLSQMLGHASPHEMIEQVNTRQTLFYENPQRHDELLQTIDQQGFVKNFESRVRRKDGHIIHISENIHVAYDKEQQFHLYEGFITDISERRQAAEALQNINKQLEKRVAERTTELSAMNARLIQAKEEADLAMNEPLAPKVERYLKIIHSSGHSLLGIINDILDFSKIEVGKMPL